MSDLSDRPTRPRASLQVALTAILISGFCFIVFSPALRNSFVNWDDDVYVYENPRVQSFSPGSIAWFFGHTYYASYIPLTMVTHMIDWAIWGDNPRGHHLTNILLHCANTVWVFLLAVLLFEAGTGSGRGSGRPPSLMIGAAVAAMLYAVHPMRVESVAWISDRKDLLCAFFFIPSVASYILSVKDSLPRHARRWYRLSLLLFVCASLSKAVAIAGPLVLASLDLLVLHREGWRKRLQPLARSLLPFLLVSMVLGTLLLLQAPHHRVHDVVADLSGSRAWLFPFYALFFYLKTSLWPWELAPIYGPMESITMVTGFIVVIAITILALSRAMTGKGALLAAWISYGVLLAPTFLGVWSGSQPIADRYAYLPLVALFLPAGWVIHRWWNSITRGGAARIHNAGVIISLTALILFLSTLTTRQLALWTDSETLWSSVVSAHPANPYYVDAYINLGTARAEAGKLDEALLAFEAAIAIDPDEADAYYNLGYVYYYRGNHRRALELFQITTELDSTYAKAFFNMGVIRSRTGDRSGALMAMQKAASLGYDPAQEFLDRRILSPR